MAIFSFKPEGARRLVPGQKGLCLVVPPVRGEPLLAEGDSHGRALLPPADHPQGPNISPETVASTDTHPCPVTANLERLLHLYCEHFLVPLAVCPCQSELDSFKEI